MKSSIYNTLSTEVFQLKFLADKGYKCV